MGSIFYLHEEHEAALAKQRLQIAEHLETIARAERAELDEVYPLGHERHGLVVSEVSMALVAIAKTIRDREFPRPLVVKIQEST